MSFPFTEHQHPNTYHTYQHTNTHQHTETCILFIEVTDATAWEIKRLSASKHMKSVLWGLARPTLSHKFSLIQLLAISTIDGVATFQIRGVYDLDPSSGKERYHGDVKLAPVLDKLRFNLDTMCETARETGEMPDLLPEANFDTVCQAHNGLGIVSLMKHENELWECAEMCDSVANSRTEDKSKGLSY